MSDIPVNALSIHDVISYLDTTGWQRQPTEWRGLGVWGSAHGAEYEVLVPLDSGFRDDAQRLRDIIHTLVKVEDRPALDIVRDIANPLVDKQEYRTRPPTPSGTIPLPMAVRALTGITDLLASAARTLKEGATPSLAGRRPAEVTSFLNGVLLDTTSPGSYVMTARVPVRRSVPPKAGLGVHAGTGEPVGREVVARMHQAITAAYQASTRVLDEGAPIEAFDEAVEHGVTTQLCEALLDLAGLDKSQPFDIGFSWARGLPSDLPVRPINFTTDTIHVLDSGARHLKEIASAGIATITGKIKEMHYDPAPHRVKVQGTLARGSVRTEETAIWVRLDADQYARASQDHQNPYLTFRFTGHLTRADGRREMLIGREGYVVVEGPR